MMHKTKLESQCNAVRPCSLICIAEHAHFIFGKVVSHTAYSFWGCCLYIINIIITALSIPKDLFDFSALIPSFSHQQCGTPQIQLTLLSRLEKTPLKGRGGTETLFSRFTMIVTNRYVYIIDTDTEISKTLPDMVDFNSVAMETHGCLHFIWLFGKRFFFRA